MGINICRYKHVCVHRVTPRSVRLKRYIRSIQGHGVFDGGERCPFDIFKVDSVTNENGSPIGNHQKYRRRRPKKAKLNEQPSKRSLYFFVWRSIVSILFCHIDRRQLCAENFQKQLQHSTILLIYTFRERHTMNLLFEAKKKHAHTYARTHTQKKANSYVI